jgi:hypothetical protein
VEKEVKINRFRHLVPTEGLPLPFSHVRWGKGRIGMYDYWHRKREWKTKAAVICIAAIALFSGLYFGSFMGAKTVVIYEQEGGPEDAESEFFMQPYDYSSIADFNASSFASVLIPAIDKEDKGTVTVLNVQVVPGTGRVLTDIDKLLFWVDTQNSIRKATMVAANVTGEDLSRYDIIYALQANATVIGGPSAGAPIAIATIAALLNRTIDGSVLITGSVNHDGSIGPVGGVLEKALASREAGADAMLVPLTQSTQVTYKTREYCEKIGWMDFCTTETYPVKVDIEEESGIDIIEVMNIRDAMEHMLLEHESQA